MVGAPSGPTKDPMYPTWVFFRLAFLFRRAARIFISPFIPTLFACSILHLFRDEPGNIPV